MKKQFRILLSVVVACTLYIAVWMYQANQIEKRIKPELESFSKEHLSNFEIRYDALQLTGFPFGINVAIQNPSIYPADQQQKNSLQYVLNGRIVLTFSIFGRLKTLDLAGISHATHTQANSTISAVTTYEAETLATFQSQDALLDYGTIKCSHLKTSLDANFNGNIKSLSEGDLWATCKRQASDNRIIIKGEAICALSSEVAQATSESVDGLDFTREFAKLLCQNIGKKHRCEFALDVPNLAFIQNIFLADIAYLDELEKDPSLILKNPIPKFSIAFKNIDAEPADSLHKMNVEISANQDQDDNVFVHFSLNGISKVSTRVVKSFEKFLDKMHTRALNWQAPSDQEKYRQLLVDHADKLLPLIPKLHEWGDIGYNNTLTVDFNKATKEWSLKAANFSLHNDAFEVAVKGDVNCRNTATDGNIVIELKRAPQFVRGLTDYYNRVIAVTNILTKSSPCLMPLSELSNMEIVYFLSALSTTPCEQSDTYSIPITFKDGNVGVGKLTAEELAYKASNLIAFIMHETYLATNR